MLADLKRSGLTPEDLAAYPIAAAKYSAPAYLIPYNGNDTLYRCRIDRAENKYISTSNVSPDIWIPPSTSLEEMYDGDLYIVEGEKKAAAVFKYWDVQNVVGIGGCWNAVKKDVANETYKLIERLQLLMTPGRTVHLILDGDVIENKNVGRAALTLADCIGRLNCAMQLYRPPTEWKGVDDWIFQDKDAAPHKLVVVPFDQLAINRSLIYEQLGCSLSANGMLITNEMNGLKLLSYHFKSQGILKDKRLGFINGKQKTISGNMLEVEAFTYLQCDISPKYPASSISGALGLYIGSNNNETDLVQGLVKDRLKWDGVERLETWGSEYFETDLPKLANEWGRILFTSLVLRILEPGCKVDVVPILNGAQGIGKTTFFEDLATIDNYSFYKSITDLPGSTGDDRTFKQTLVSALVVDLGEGVIFESKKTSSDRLKQFLTDRQDEYRVAYAKNNTVAQRGFICVGTTNRGDQLTDYTGSRRFLYLNVKKITRLPYPIKLQIMAEVAARHKEISESSWYDLRLTMDDMPQQARDENPHVTQVNELLNVEHYRADALTESLRLLIENGDASVLRGEGHQVITPYFVAARLGQAGNMGFINTVGRKLIELSSSPTFPYVFEKTRKRGPQLDYKQGHKELYTGHTTSDQVMFTCYIVKRK